MKLYVIIESTLARGLACAQAIHAAFAFREEHPAITEQWRPDNNVVVLTADPSEPLSALRERLQGAGLALSSFHEPDLNGKLTALCVEPAGKSALRELRLA